MKQISSYILLCFLLSGFGCKAVVQEPVTETLRNPETPQYDNLAIETNKAIYSPGEQVNFEMNETITGNAVVRYKFLGEVIQQQPLIEKKWIWAPPTDDFKGYMVEVSDSVSGEILATIAVDVSSSWTKFPRYGFLSRYGNIGNNQIEKVISNLNRHHINGIQFYDWHNKHHKPMAMNGSSPATMWKDVMNRDIYFSTVEKYIETAHFRNMKTMFYNLVYGAWDNADADGVKPEWYIYTDKGHASCDVFNLPMPPFLSKLYLLDPSNTGWQQYLIAQDKNVYQCLAFDGYHMDQVGERGTRYTYDGTWLQLSKTFQSFIEADKAAYPAKFRVMNAVTQYGQEGIAAAPSDFLYSEVWDPFNSFTDLSNIIKQNNVLGSNRKNSVLAAYINYNLAEQKGYFNTASVLMADAVIFAFGGDHIELGEHLLGKEYFPNDNLEMRDDLKLALPSYYDFLVAYENLLRDGGEFNSIDLTSVDDQLPVAKWPAAKGMVAVISKKVDNRQVFHLINFKNSTTDQWRDSDGIQAVPALIKDAKLKFNCSETVQKIWVASPDVIGGASRSINFKQQGDQVYFTLPELKYWTMVVVVYE